MTPEDLKPAKDQTQAQGTKLNPLGDLGIHAAGDPDSAEAAPGAAITSEDASAAFDDADAAYQAAHPGKTVFKPGELNNAGEDKEYFHPKKDHQFDTPKDANTHALTPDVEVTPGNTVKTIR